MLGSRRITIALAAAVVLVLVVTGSALAGGKGGGSKGSLTLVVLSGSTLEAAALAEPHYGDEITFEVSTTATNEPYVNVRCYQGADFVYDGWAGFFDAAWFGQTYVLSSPSWSGGAADCDARLIMWGRNGRERTLASVAFHVAA